MRTVHFLSLVGFSALALVLFVALSSGGVPGAAAASLLVVAGLALALTLLLPRTVRRAARFTKAMASGEIPKRLPETASGDTGELYRALNRLAEAHEQQLRDLTTEKAETELILQEMGEGVLALSSEGVVVRANAQMRRVIGATDPIKGRTISTIFRNPLLVRFLSPESVSENGKQGEFEVFGRTMLVTAKRLRAGGVVAVFADLTLVRRLNRVRTEFVANASHELKTPLTAIRGFAETLLDPEIPAEDRANFAGRIVKHANRISAIVEDLITLARLEEPGQAVASERVLLRPLVERTVELLTPNAESQGATIKVEIEPDNLAARGDPEGIRQIIENLIENALRHSSAREVGLRGVRSGDDEVTVTVWDRGTGIPSIHIDRVFERFYRVDPSRSRSTGGTGLGLAIVKHWTEQMGGRVSVESEVGMGTAVRVELPSA